MKRLVFLAALGVLAGCGGGGHTTTAPPPGPNPAAAMRKLIAQNPAYAGTITVLTNGGSWAVVESSGHGKAHAVAFKLDHGKWKVDPSGRVKLEILGPQPGSTAPKVPQLAIQYTSKKAVVDDAIWLDGVQLGTNGGGTRRRATIFGSPPAALSKGEHVAVGFARTEQNGTATAWVFSTR